MLIISLIILFLIFIYFSGSCKCNERYLIPSDQLPKNLMYIHN